MEKEIYDLNSLIPNLSMIFLDEFNRVLNKYSSLISNNVIRLAKKV